MLKGLSFACSLLICATSFAQRPSLAPSPISLIISTGSWMMQGTTRLYQVDVQAKGATFEIAKTDAFRLAVEQAVGTLLLSETEMQNGNITRRDVINYASGYVDRFEVLSRVDNPDTVQVTFRVWVSHSQIANRLLGQSKDNGQFDGSRASAQISTLLQERQAGDRAVAAVLGDFPQRAFTVKVGKLELKFDGARNAVVEIPFLLSWNYDYLISLQEVLKKTSQSSAAQEPNGAVLSCMFDRSICTRQAYVRINTKIPDKFFFSKNTLLLGFDDNEKLNLIKNKMINSQPRVQITVRDNSNQVISNKCYQWQMSGFVYDYYEQTVVIDGFYVMSARNTIEYGQRTNALADLNDVEVKVVASSQCTNY